MSMMKFSTPEDSLALTNREKNEVMCIESYRKRILIFVGIDFFVDQIESGKSFHLMSYKFLAKAGVGCAIFLGLFLRYKMKFNWIRNSTERERFRFIEKENVS